MKNVTYISAGAGSGKTYTLTTKLAELVAKDKNDPEHIEPEQVILTTFTVKAANEFKEKAKAELYKIGKYDEASRLDHALIGTIDSVATTLIQKYWYAIGLAPKQGVMDDIAKETYISQSIANIPTDEDLKLFSQFRDAFDVCCDNKPDEKFWKQHLKDIVEKSISFDITDFTASIEESLKILKMLSNGTSIAIDTEQRRSVLDKLRGIIGNCSESAKKNNALKEIDSLRNLSEYLSDIEWFVKFNKILKNCPAYPKKIVIPDLIEKITQTASNLWQSREVYEMQEKYIRTIFRLAERWSEEYTDYKRNKRIVDFCDIEHYMHKLLQDQEVAAEIGRTYTHLFVDEFQDCSPIQVKIFMALANVVKQSYWVGDTKQAIYGFRASDTALTKAVSDIIAMQKDGCRYETLGKSWRSVPTLVKACNNAFERIFRPIFGDDTQQQVRLESAMELHPEKFNTPLANRAKKPLRFLNITERKSPRSQKLKVADLAQYIKNVIDRENVAMRDIAVLGKTNDDLNEVQDALVELDIPVSRETTLDVSSKACQLMLALIRFTANPQDDLAKAEIAYLTQENMGIGAIIDSKLIYNSTPKDERDAWLGDTEMIKRVNKLRSSVKYQGIGALMETLAVELDVKNIMARWSAPLIESMANVKALILAAKQYENRCNEMTQAATPSGFVDYLNGDQVVQPSTDDDGVQLLTMHKSKGLEWKYVFLLMDDNFDNDKIMRFDFYGIHHFHPEAPSASNLHPQMCLRLLPWIFGNVKKVPNAISPLISNSNDFKKQHQYCIDERARLLYVGMTRASEVLVLVPWYENSKFEWFKQCGLTEAGSIDNGDVLGIGEIFDVVSAEYPTSNSSAGEIVVQPYRRLNYFSDTPSSAGSRTIAPSGLKGKSETVNVAYCSGQYIKINSGKLQGRDYSEVGDCIHNVYAAIDRLDREEVKHLIASHDMAVVLPNADEIIAAWHNLRTFLREQFGKPLAEYHERPFRRMQADGSIVIGSIDYIYQATSGSVLIDFKTFPQVAAITDPTSDHYAGLYAGQLDAYTEALQAAGETVVKRYIYYPVSGTLVEI